MPYRFWKPVRSLWFALTIVTLLTSIARAQPHRYSYDLKLSEDHKTLQGTARILFKNNGARALDTIYLHLPPRALEWKNSFLNKQFAEFQDVDLFYADKAETGYIILNNGRVNGKTFTPCQACEFVKLPLNEALAPGDSVRVSFGFEIGLPLAEWIGVGHNENSIRIIDWLPRIPVLDSSGFHPYPVTWQRDVYPSRDYYEVDFDLPANLLVATNTTLTTPHERARIDSLRQRPFQNLHSETGRKQLRFEHFGTNLQFILSPDFYIFPFGKNNTLYLLKDDPLMSYIVDSVETRLGRFFRSELGEDPSTDYDLVLLDEKVTEYQSDHLITLEYARDVFSLSQELVQAKAETFFRYRLAPDGFKNVWLARGLPYYYKYLFIQANYPERKWIPFISNTFIGKFFSLDDFDFSYQNQFLYLFLARQGLDQKMSTPADSLTRLNYEAVAQGKTCLAFNHFRHFTSSRDFKRSMRDYVLQNLDGHATPKDLAGNFKFYLNRDVDWFFNTWIHSSEVYDYQLEKFEYCPTITTATVENNGRLAIPYSLTGIKDGEPVLTEWFEGHEGEKSVQMYHEDYDKVVLNYNNRNAEYSQKDNTYFDRFLLPRVERLDLQFYQTFEDPNQFQVFWMPTAGYNAYDKLLLGVSLSNIGIVDKKFEYVFGPEYSTGQNQLMGYAGFAYNHIPARSNIFRKISPTLYSRYYHYDEDLAYFRLSPGINFYFRKPYPKSTVIRKLRFRSVHVERQLGESFEGVANDISNASYSVFNATYLFEETKIFAPYTIRTDFLLGNQFSNLSVEGDFRWMLPNKKWLIWRNFGGLFFSNEFAESGQDQNYYSLGLSGTQDFLFDYSFIGRSDETGIWSRQFFVTDGGFKSATGVFADEWMLTTNLSVPIWSVFGVFGDMGYADNTDKLYYDYGFRLALLTDFVEVYFPAGNQDRFFLTEENYARNIRFVLDFDLGNIIGRLRRGYY